MHNTFQFISVYFILTKKRFSKQMMIFGNRRQNSLERIRINIHQGLLVCTQAMEKLFSRSQKTFKFYNP